MLFNQIKHIGDNFSYIIAEEISGEGIVIDPSLNNEVIIKLAKKQGLNIKYIINTHDHRDHIAGNRELKLIFGSNIVAHKLTRIEKDMEVVDGSTLSVDGILIKIIHTPGHSPGSICILVNNKLITGDTLFIGECGRTDLPGGSAKDMYNSLFHKLMMLDDDIEVYPGHDYGPKPYSTIGEERRTNYTLENRSLAEFIEFMKEP